MKTRKVEDLPDRLSLILDQREVNSILDDIGVEHDPDSIVAEDGYNTLFVDSNEHGQYMEVWGIHYNVPMDFQTAYKLL